MSFLESLRSKLKAKQQTRDEARAEYERTLYDVTLAGKASRAQDQRLEQLVETLGIGVDEAEKDAAAMAELITLEKRVIDKVALGKTAVAKEAELDAYNAETNRILAERRAKSADIGAELQRAMDASAMWGDDQKVVELRKRFPAAALNPANATYADLVTVAPRNPTLAEIHAAADQRAEDRAEDRKREQIAARHPDRFRQEAFDHAE